MDSIDSLKFAREKQIVRGSLPVARFERLRDSLFDVATATDGDSSANLDYQVQGGLDARGRPVLRLKVVGRLSLPCQRCLGEFEFGLTIDAMLRLVPEATLDAEQSDDPDEPDCIAASSELDLAALIEDEILLALPAYPRHEGQGCGSGDGKATGAKVTAFSVLSELGALKQKAFKSKE